MGRFGVLNTIESLASGRCLKTIRHLSFDSERDGCFMSGRNVLLSVDINDIPYLLLILFDKKGRKSCDIRNSVNTIASLKIKDFFNDCIYLPEEFCLLDAPANLYDVVLFEQLDKKVVLSNDISPDLLIAQLNEIGGVVVKMMRAGLVLNKEMFEVLSVDANGRIRLQMNDHVYLIPVYGEKNYGYISFYKEVALSLLVKWSAVFGFTCPFGESVCKKGNKSGYQYTSELKNQIVLHLDEVRRVLGMDLSLFNDVIFAEKIYLLVDIIEQLKKIRSCEDVKKRHITLVGKLGDESIDYFDSDRYYLAVVHSEDRIAILDKMTGLWGVIDYSGYLIIDFKYHAINDFDEGLAVVMLDEKAGVINRYDDIVLPIVYDEIEWNCVDNVFHISIDGKHSLYDRNGECLSKEYKWIGSFSEAMAVVETFDAKLGFVSPLGEELVPPVYLNVLPFKDGVAQIQTEDQQWHTIDKQGVLLD